MSGARIALTASIELQKTSTHFAVYTMFAGVGQGIAVLIERV